MFDVPHRLERVFFHLDFGVSCSYPGCPPITRLWGRTWHADVYLLLGGLVLGVTTGLAAAAFCATHPRRLATRAIETLALILYSTPVYLFALGLLLLFEPIFGVLPSPVFFHPLDYAAPLENPWRFFDAMLVPWILVAAPFGGGVVRRPRGADNGQVAPGPRPPPPPEGGPRRNEAGPAPGGRGPPPRGALVGGGGGARL